MTLIGFSGLLHGDGQLWVLNNLRTSQSSDLDVPSQATADYQILLQASRTRGPFHRSVVFCLLSAGGNKETTIVQGKSKPPWSSLVKRQLCDYIAV